MATLSVVPKVINRDQFESIVYAKKAAVYPQEFDIIVKNISQRKQRVCALCDHWKYISNTSGECHRHAPLSSSSSVQTTWNKTDPFDFCGEFKEFDS